LILRIKILSPPEPLHTKMDAIGELAGINATLSASMMIPLKHITGGQSEMAFFLVSFDLHHQRNYQLLWTELSDKGGEKLLESLWLIELDNVAGEVRDWLKELVDHDDSFAVIEVKRGSRWSTSRSRKHGVDWLRQHL
jgi:hypothetical protein